MLLRLEAWAEEAVTCITNSHPQQSTLMSPLFISNNKQHICTYLLTIKRTPNRYDVKPFILRLYKNSAFWTRREKIDRLWKELRYLSHTTICCCHILSLQLLRQESLKCQFLCFRLLKHEYLASSWRQHYGLSDLTIMRRQLDRQKHRMLTLIVKTGSSHLKLFCIDAERSAGSGYMMNHTVNWESQGLTQYPH